MKSGSTTSKSTLSKASVQNNLGSKTASRSTLKTTKSRESLLTKSVTDLKCQQLKGHHRQSMLTNDPAETLRTKSRKSEIATVYKAMDDNFNIINGKNPEEKKSINTKQASAF